MSLILDSYKSVLPSFACEFDEEGYISLRNPVGTASPSTVDGKRLVIPTDKFLRKGFGEDFQPFHPLSEALSRRGTSPVIQYLQRAAKAHISFVVHKMAEQLLTIAADKSSHKDLPPDATDFLKKLADADKATVGLFEKLMPAATKKNRLVAVYLKNGGTFDGKKVNRMAIIRFPILEDLQAETDDVLGIKMAKKQRKVLTALFKLIVPFGDNPEEYAFGTTSRVAPYYTSLLTAYHKVIVMLNQLINRYAIPLQIPVNLIPVFDLDLIDEFPKIYNLIPPLNGNLGGRDEDTPETAEAVQTQQQAPSVTAPQASTPQLTRPAAVVSKPVEKDTVSMSEFMAAQNPQPQMMQQQMGMMMPMNNGMMMPGNGMMQMNGMGGMMQPMQMGNMQPQGIQANAPIPAWMGGQQQGTMMMGNGQPANPYMQAVAGMRQTNGLGLV
ncbi:hypothetical protein RVBP21_3340 [Pseudomonas phage BRkr]|nr:hypothetical protein RVBP21_3340 [Pseudomonas phage BRkr]